MKMKMTKGVQYYNEGKNRKIRREYYLQGKIQQKERKRRDDEEGKN